MYTPKEQEYVIAWKALKDDVDHARNYLLVHFATYRTLRENEEVQRRINQSKRYWNFVLNGITGGIFLSLGRLFDTNGGHGFRRLFKLAAKHREIFTPASLRARKENPHFFGEVLDEYMSDKIDLSTGYLDSLSQHAEDYRTLYERACGEVRDKVYAHTVFAEREKIHGAFRELDDKEIHDLVAFSYRMVAALYELFNNGRAMALPLELPEYPNDWIPVANESWKLPSLDEWGLCDEVNDFLMSQLAIPPKA